MPPPPPHTARAQVVIAGSSRSRPHAFDVLPRGETRLYELAAGSADEHSLWLRELERAGCVVSHETTPATAR